MNKVFLIGNLTKDPELTTINTGASVCKFSIAVNRRFANNDGNRDVDYFNINAWRGLGENCAKFLKKGSKVCVVGQLQTRNYDAADGTKRYVTDITADEVEFLNRVGDGAGSSASAPASDGGMQPLEDDSLPF